MIFISTDITFESLEDQIDAKILQYANDCALSSGHVELKVIVDGDYATLVSDEDVQAAFEIWSEEDRKEQERRVLFANGRC